MDNSGLETEVWKRSFLIAHMYVMYKVVTVCVLFVVGSWVGVPR